MSPKDMRNVLLTRTIEIIANEGLDKTTTKAITIGTSINESYIYRLFSDKADMLIKAFDLLDEELVAKLFQHLPIMSMHQFDYETRCRLYFKAIWEFLLGNKEKCLAFVSYYYSPYFRKFSSLTHKKRYMPFVERISEAFKDEADVWMILSHIFNVMLDFAVKVHNDEMPKEDNYAEHVFRIIYVSVKQYFKEAEEREF